MCKDGKLLVPNLEEHIVTFTRVPVVDSRKLDNAQTKSKFDNLL
jgi:hypothetical protein